MEIADLNNKLIFTIDLDAFFASAEEQRNPKLIGKPMGVGHELNGRGVVTTSNYEARKLGIKAGMPLWKVKKITNNFTLVEPDYEYYQEKANEFFRVVMEFSDKVQIASIDECYVDVTKLTNRFRPIEIALMIQNKVIEKTGLSCSVGISTNILLSKMASNLDKPKGVSTLYKHEIPVKLWPMEINEMHMIGDKTAAKLIDNGIKTIGDLAKIKDNLELYQKVRSEIGVNLEKHIDACNGLSTNEIEKEPDQLKSISKSKTFPNLIGDVDILISEIRELFEFALYRCNRRKLSPKTIYLAVKERKELSANSVSKTLSKATSNKTTLWNIILQCIDSLVKEGKTYRYVSIGFGNLVKQEKEYHQLTLDESNKLPPKNKMQLLAERISLDTGVEVVMGSTMKDNIRYEDKDPVMRDNVRFKRWDK